MADQKVSRQPIVAIDTSAPPTLQVVDLDGIQPITIPGSGSSSLANNTATGSYNGIEDSTSPTSPSKSVGTKTGTRSTFCPNVRRKSTKLTDADYEEHDGPVPAFQPQGWLQMLGLKKSANFGQPLDGNGEPCQQSYY
ncbi:hypothetical protein BGZ58_009092 [Dissophora ornata]|nr:hypothetical protein BGZ58_009092 [Dissophora ornata]